MPVQTRTKSHNPRADLGTITKVLPKAVFALVLGLTLALAPETRAAVETPLTTARLRPSESDRIMSKTEVMNALREIQGRGRQALETLDKLVQKQMQESLKLQVSGSDFALADLRFRRFTETLENLERRRQEHVARQEFFNQLIFQVDTKWPSQPLREFLTAQLLEMAISDLNRTDSSAPRSWKFLTYLSVALRELPEPRENLISFLDGYLNFSTILNPKPPHLYLQNRNYTSGPLSMAARPVSPEEAGSFADAKMRAIEKSKQAAAGTKTAPGAQRDTQAGVTQNRGAAEPVPARADIELRFKTQIQAPTPNPPETADPGAPGNE